MITAKSISFRRFSVNAALVRLGFHCRYIMKEATVHIQYFTPTWISRNRREKGEDSFPHDWSCWELKHREPGRDRHLTLVVSRKIWLANYPRGSIAILLPRNLAWYKLNGRTNRDGSIVRNLQRGQNSDSQRLEQEAFAWYFYYCWT